jgi:hypothetical protein
VAAKEDLSAKKKQENSGIAKEQENNENNRSQIASTRVTQLGETSMAPTSKDSPTKALKQPNENNQGIAKEQEKNENNRADESTETT